MAHFKAKIQIDMHQIYQVKRPLKRNNLSKLMISNVCFRGSSQLHLTEKQGLEWGEGEVVGKPGAGGSLSGGPKISLIGPADL